MFAEEVPACPCGGRRIVPAFMVDTNLARSVLTALGLAPSPDTEPAPEPVPTWAPEHQSEPSS
jgi:hypothetical protein